MMTMTTITTDGAALFRLLSWMSPAFPTGAYAYSHGLEWAVESGDVTSAETLLAWLADLLHIGTGRTDAILLRHAHRAAGDGRALADLADLAAALAPCRERQLETLAQGDAFLSAAMAWGCERPVLANTGCVAYPVAVGAVAGLHGVSEDAACIGFLQAFAANLVSAAVRLVPLGQSAGLHTLCRLEPAILTTAANTRLAGLDDIGGACFRSDIAAMRHETQYTRLFRT